MGIKAIYFDLDNTLHNFYLSSSIAMSKVYESIKKSHGTNIESLKDAYSEILRKAEEHAFCDGRKSIDYRTERFTELLSIFGKIDTNLVTELVEIYSKNIESSMKIFPEVEGVLRSLQKKKPLYMVTEGPGDAQRKAVEILGLSDYFKDVIISGEARMIKSDGGLFEYSLKKTNLKPSDVIHVGDSYERDVLGARIAGIPTVWISRGKFQEAGIRPLAKIHNLLELENKIAKFL